MSTAASIPVKTSPSATSVITSALTKRVTSITKQMKQGKRTLVFNSTNVGAGSGGILLTHGYCSGSNPFQARSQDFTNAYYFLDASASRPTDQFAQMLASFATSKGLNSYALIGHSQGGLASAHLLNYYESGADNAAGGRLIQTVGSPFKGCSGAGTAANLIAIFGYGCGTNYDLTTDGATLWLSGITSDVRDNMFSYTTTYKTGNFFGDYCNMAVNLVLEWPNDGTCELVATNIGQHFPASNFEGECHSTDMKYSPQYWDTTRNAQMNAAAARGVAK